jgi:hypothetical protein
MPGFNRSLSRLAHYTSSAWDCGPTDLVAAGSNPYTVNRSGFTDFSPFAVSSFMALPVTWLSISGRNDSKNNIINWTVSAEKNNDYYVIEASTTGNRYTEIGRINGAGSTNTDQRYSFTHFNVTATQYYYRIKQVDIDGHFSFSKVVKVIAATSTSNDMKVLSNPVLKNLVVSIMARQNFTGSMNVTDATGKLLYKKNLLLNAGNNIIDLGSFKQAAGIYYLIFVGYRGETEVMEFIKR